MRILVVSDSHSGTSFMLNCAEAVKPEVIVHLGDHYDDGEVLRDANPRARVFLLPGNCDRYRAPLSAQEIIVGRVGGVDLYMTHGHRHNVKSTLLRLVADARAAGCAAALYGHTHQADCHQEPDGLWVLNPGSCGYYGGSAGLMEIVDGRIRSCRIIRASDLEEFT